MKSNSLKGLIVVIGLSLLFFGCKSSTGDYEKTPDGVFNKAMERFTKEDWLEASQLFDLIVLQYQASQYADDAQYHLAEIHFKKGEYYLAAFNFNLVRRNYPNSEFYKISLYKTAMCYYEISPTYDRDQEYTLKAISTFQDYQRLYPGDSLFDKSTAYIQELRDKLGEGYYFISELYRKMMSYKSSVVYLDVVLTDYQDTKFFEPSIFKKAEALSEMGKYNESSIVVNQYKKQFPEGKYIKEIIELERKIRPKL